MNIKKLVCLCSALLPSVGLGLLVPDDSAFAQVPATLIPNAYEAVLDEEYDKKPWQEIEAQLPPAPREETLLPFYVSATASNVFRIDGSSLSVAPDGVVRYVLVVQSASGVRNVSFEGIRCETREWRLYAFGRPDGSWSKSRSNQWRPIENRAVNQYHATLHREYFCPDGIAIQNAREGVMALRAGGHPGVSR